jgi:hypothetical protein
MMRSIVNKKARSLLILPWSTVAVVPAVSSPQVLNHRVMTLASEHDPPLLFPPSPLPYSSLSPLSISIYPKATTVST